MQGVLQILHAGVRYDNFIQEFAVILLLGN